MGVLIYDNICIYMHLEERKGDMSSRQYDISDEWKLYMYLLKCAIREKKMDLQQLDSYENIESSILNERSSVNSQVLLLKNNIYEYALYRNEDVEKENNIGYIVKVYEKYKYMV